MRWLICWELDAVGGSTLSTSEMDFIEDADWLGNRRWIDVEFEDHRVVAWRTISLPRTRPPWLERALKTTAWSWLPNCVSNR
jgi:hypothetical protein